MTALSGCSRIIENVPPVDDNSANSLFDTADNSRYVLGTFDAKEQEYYELIRQAAESSAPVVTLPE